MFRLISYFLVILIFVVIINLLKYNNNFKRLTYESSFIEVVAYVCSAFMGCGYMGIHPISQDAKILIIILCLTKFLILIEIVMWVSKPIENIHIFHTLKHMLKKLEE